MKKKVGNVKIHLHKIEDTYPLPFETLSFESVQIVFIDYIEAFIKYGIIKHSN